MKHGDEFYMASDMTTISVNVPQAVVRGLMALVEKGLYASRSEAIRVALRDLLLRERDGGGQ